MRRILGWAVVACLVLYLAYAPAEAAGKAQTVGSGIANIFAGTATIVANVFAGIASAGS